MKTQEIHVADFSAVIKGLHEELHLNHAELSGYKVMHRFLEVVRKQLGYKAARSKNPDAKTVVKFCGRTITFYHGRHSLVIDNEVKLPGGQIHLHSIRLRPTP